MDAWLSQFPTREIDEPATKDFVHAEMANLRTEIGEMRGEMRAGFVEVKAELHAEMHRLAAWIIGVVITAIIAAAGVGRL